MDKEIKIDFNKEIGKECLFWNENNLRAVKKKLKSIDTKRKDKFETEDGIWYDVCVPSSVIK